MSRFTKNGTYTCKFVEICTNEISNSLPYHNSILYNKMCICDKISVAKINFTDDTITVYSKDFPNFNNHIYTCDTYSRAYISEHNDTNYYILPITIYELEKPNVTNMTIPLTLKVSDLTHIGGTVYEGDYGTNFILGSETSNIEFMIARTIINALGYNILDHTDYSYVGEDDPDYWEKLTTELVTDLPYSLYNEISGLASAERHKQEKKLLAASNNKSNVN
jgi:hypothetical protein